MAVMEWFSVNVRLSYWQKVLFITACMGVLDFIGAAGPLTAAVSRGLQPVRQVWVSAAAEISAGWQNLQKLPKAAERIQDLELRLAEASASLAELSTLRRENEELRFLLTNTDRRSTQRTIIAAPILAFAQPAIAAGSQAGVQEGSAVLSRNILLGRIIRVMPYESQVQLLAASDAQPVLGQTESGVKGLIIGDGRKVLFTQVPKEAALAAGDRIVTAGQPGVEQDLAVGRVIRVMNDPAASVQSAVIEQYVSFFEIPVVEVR